MVSRLVDLFMTNTNKLRTSTYDHRSQGKVDPVRSRILKLGIGRLVLRWVTTGEYPLLYVFAFWMKQTVARER